LGAQRAILFDAGTRLSDIVPVVRSLTNLPVTVISSHLHFDHVGALGRFDKAAVLDAPALRARVRESRLTLRRYEFLGFADRLATPGHTPTSVSLHDASRHQLFAGDFIYPGELYVFLPGASRSAYHATTTRLLSIIDPATQVFAAHMADPAAVVKAPVLGVADLRVLQSALVAIERGTLPSSGFYPRIFPARASITFATGWAWNNR